MPPRKKKPAAPEMFSLGGDAKAHPNLEPLAVSVNEVKPHPDNPRLGDTDAIIESMLVNGIYRAIYVQRSTGFIVSGNHTYAAALELGATVIPVVWLDVDDDAARRILLVDNRAADIAKYDEGLLLNLLRDLDSLAGTAYDDRAIERLLSAVESPIDLLQGLDASADTTAADPEALASAMADSQDLFRLPYGLNAEQRRVVLQAIKHARAEHPGYDGAAAIALICSNYLEGTPQ